MVWLVCFLLGSNVLDGSFFRCRYGFNCGSTLRIFQASNAVAYVAITTSLSASAGGLSAFCINMFLEDTPDVGSLMNGILAGLVSITANAHGVEPWAALIIGAVGGCVYNLSSRLLLRLRIDDAMDASPVHFFCGIWGILATGLFLSDKVPANIGGQNGLFYGDGYHQLLIQIVGMIAIFAWTALWMIPTFWLLMRFRLLRVNEKDELVGLDVSQHGMRAYEVDQELLKAYRDLSQKLDELEDRRVKLSNEDTAPNVKISQWDTTSSVTAMKSTQLAHRSVDTTLESNISMLRSESLALEKSAHDFAKSSARIPGEVSLQVINEAE